MPDFRGMSNFCAKYSIVGIAFMFMVAMLLTYQPFFVGGIEDVAGAIRNAYGAMATFLFTFVLSVVYLVQDVLIGSGGGRSRRSHNNNNNERFDRRMRSGNDYYDGVPTNSNVMIAGGGGPEIMQEYSINLDLPRSVEESYFT